MHSNERRPPPYWNGLRTPAMTIGAAPAARTRAAIAKLSSQRQCSVLGHRPRRVLDSRGLQPAQDVLRGRRVAAAPVDSASKRGESGRGRRREAGRAANDRPCALGCPLPFPFPLPLP